MSVPIQRLLDQVQWRELPAPDPVDDGLPYATHEGTLVVGDVELRCYTLSDGWRVIHGDDLELWLAG